MSKRLVLSVVLGIVALGLTAADGLAVEPTIEATGSSLATYAWTPSTAEVESGGSVAFKNPTANFHGLAWEAGSPIPSCTGTSSTGAANWSGSCTFSQGGTYHFYCPVHPSVMKGTVTVTGPAAPVVSTGSATGVTETEATLNGTVNPSEQATSYFFEYGTTTAYGSETGPGSAGNGGSVSFVSMPVAGLSPQTTYHFRLTAENATGASHGVDRTFRTAGGTEEPPPPTEEPPAPSEPSPAAPASTSPAPGPAPAPTVVPLAPPETKITLKPRAKTKDRTPTFRFTATVLGATFRCSIDRKPFKPCRSPYTTASLKPGRHTFRVAAVADGSIDPTPAGAGFRVVPKQKKR